MIFTKCDPQLGKLIIETTPAFDKLLREVGNSEEEFQKKTAERLFWMMHINALVEGTPKLVRQHLAEFVEKSIAVIGAGLNDRVERALIEVVAGLGPKG